MTAIRASNLIEAGRIGLCVLMELDNTDGETFLIFKKDGLPANFLNVPLIIVEIVDNELNLVPFRSNLPVEMMIKVPAASKCKFKVIRNRELILQRYPKRHEQILKQYPYLRKGNR